MSNEVLNRKKGLKPPLGQNITVSVSSCCGVSQIPIIFSRSVSRHDYCSSVGLITNGSLFTNCEKIIFLLITRMSFNADTIKLHLMSRALIKPNINERQRNQLALIYLGKYRVEPQNKTRAVLIKIKNRPEVGNCLPLLEIDG
jgi:hypothetical protein